VRPDVSFLQLTSRKTEVPGSELFLSSKKQIRKSIVQAAVEQKMLEKGDESETPICRICLSEEEDL